MSCFFESCVDVVKLEVCYQPAGGRFTDSKIADYSIPFQRQSMDMARLRKRCVPELFTSVGDRLNIVLEANRELIQGIRCFLLRHAPAFLKRIPPVRLWLDTFCHHME